MNNLKRLVENTEAHLNTANKTSSANNNANYASNLLHLSTELAKKNPFKETNVTEYESFPQFDGKLLAKLELNKFLKWAKDRCLEFESEFSM